MGRKTGAVIGTLAKTLAEMKPPPCDGCKSEIDCGEVLMACPAFWWYSRGTVKNCNGMKALGVRYADLTEEERYTPTGHMYDVVFPEKD